MDGKLSLPDEANDLTELARKLGDAEADRSGLRAAVESVLRRVASKVIYMRGYDGLPARLRSGVYERLEIPGGVGQTAAMYDTATKNVYLFTHVVKSPDRAVWNVAHEIAGHEGLRSLLGERLYPALEVAMRNETVSELAATIALGRNIDTRPVGRFAE